MEPDAVKSAGAGRAGKRLALTKWYFDCATPDGRVAIGYWASLAWRGLSWTWQKVVLYEPGSPPLRRSRVGAAPAPEAGEGAILWRAPALGAVIAVEPRQPPIEERLFEDGEGRVDWRVAAPAALVSVELTGLAPLRGPGYAERIRIGVPPWKLPIRELRWGRWIDADARRSLVWIEWRGSEPRTWVYADGRRADSAIVSDERIQAGNVELELAEGRTLEAPALAETVAAIPGLQALVPRPLLALRQTIRCSQGTLRGGRAAPLGGRAVHEVVVFR